MTVYEFIIQLLNTYLPIVLVVSLLVWGIIVKFEKEVRKKINDMEEAPGYKWPKRPINKNTKENVHKIDKSQERLKELEAEVEILKTEKELSEFEKEEALDKSDHLMTDLINELKTSEERQMFWFHKFAYERLDENSVDILKDMRSLDVWALKKHSYSYQILYKSFGQLMDLEFMNPDFMTEGEKGGDLMFFHTSEAKMKETMEALEANAINFVVTKRGKQFLDMLIHVI